MAGAYVLLSIACCFIVVADRRGWLTVDSLLLAVGCWASLGWSLDPYRRYAGLCGVWSFHSLACVVGTSLVGLYTRTGMLRRCFEFSTSSVPGEKRFCAISFPRQLSDWSKILVRIFYWWKILGRVISLQ